MVISRKKAVSIKLNIDELYMLGERVRWKINRFLVLQHHVYTNDKTINKKIKSYLKVLDKICNLANLKPFPNDRTIKFTSTEIASIWDAISKLDDTYEYMLSSIKNCDDDWFDTINDINKCNLFYKDLEYYQKLYIYIYTEFALAMRDSGNQNIYIDGPLLKARSTYIYDYLSDYRLIYEFESIDTTDLYISFLIAEPRYKKVGEEKFRLKKCFKHDSYSLFNVTLKDLHEAQDILNNSNIDYDYILNTIPNIEGYKEDFLDEIQSVVNGAHNTLLHREYGPGWRLILFFHDVLDINGNQISSFNLDYEIRNRVKDFDFIDTFFSFLDEDDLHTFTTERLQYFDELKEELKKLSYSQQYLNAY